MCWLYLAGKPPIKQGIRPLVSSFDSLLESRRLISAVACQTLLLLSDCDFGTSNIKSGFQLGSAMSNKKTEGDVGWQYLDVGWQYLNGESFNPSHKLVLETNLN